MYAPQDREAIWNEFDADWDVVIIGGGITGVAVLRETTRVGLRAVLLEADDFASGTSSRSSKLVHGGLRYLRNANLKLTAESVRERNRLISAVANEQSNAVRFLCPSTFVVMPLRPPRPGG